MSVIENSKNNFHSSEPSHPPRLPTSYESVQFLHGWTACRSYKWFFNAKTRNEVIIFNWLRATNYYYYCYWMRNLVLSTTTTAEAAAATKTKTFCIMWTCESEAQSQSQSQTQTHTWIAANHNLHWFVESGTEPIHAFEILYSFSFFSFCRVFIASRHRNSFDFYRPCKWKLLS